MSDSIVSLNLSETGFQLAEAALSNNRLEISSLGSDSLDTPLFETSNEQGMQTIAKHIEGLFTKSQIKKRNINVILPDSISYSHILQMPKLKEKELLSAIRYQADQFIPMPIDQTALDLEILYEDTVSKNLIVLIVASPLTVIEKVEMLVEMAGCIPEKVENELSATSRFVSTLYKGRIQKSGTLFVNVGETSTSLYFYSQQLGLIVDSHSFKLGKNLFIRDVQANTSFDPKKSEEVLKRIGFGQEGAFRFDELLKPVLAEWGKEIEKFLLSAKEKHGIGAIEAVYLFNKAVEIHGLDSKLGSTISLPTGLFDFSPLIKQTPLTTGLGKDITSYVTTLGGCLR